MSESLSWNEDVNEVTATMPQTQNLGLGLLVGHHLQHVSLPGETFRTLHITAVIVLEQ